MVMVSLLKRLTLVGFPVGIPRLAAWMYRLYGTGTSAAMHPTTQF